LNDGKESKKERNYVDIIRLIKSLQKRAGHQPCFKGERRFECEEYDCAWRHYCLKSKIEKEHS
jgi:hypothetical protein